MIGWSMLPAENNPSQAVPIKLRQNTDKSIGLCSHLALHAICSPWHRHTHFGPIHGYPVAVPHEAGATGKQQFTLRPPTSFNIQKSEYLNCQAEILDRMKFTDFTYQLLRLLWRLTLVLCLPTRHPRCVQLNAWWYLIAFGNQDSSSSSSFSILTWRIRLAPRGCNEKHQTNCYQ